MRWQRPLRYAIALAGLGFAVFLYARFERRPSVPKVAAPPKMEDGAAFQSVMSPGGKQVRYNKDSKEVGSWSYSRMRQFTDGRRIVEQFRYAGGGDGKPFVVSADLAEMKAPAAGQTSDDLAEETHLTGHVVLKEQDGMELKTNDATYRDSVATLEIPGPMTFADARTSGSAVGAAYEKNQQLMTLRDQAVVTMAPDAAGQGRFDARAKSMLINRATHFVSMDGTATIRRDREVIKAATVQMHLNDDNQGVQMMELHQDSSIVPVAGAGNTPEMHGDDINLEFLADGRTIKHAQLVRKASMLLAGNTGKKQITGDVLDVTLGADGQTVTKLSGSGGPVTVALPASADVPPRSITARQFDASGDEKVGLTAAVFRQNVEFNEMHPAGKGQGGTRTVRAKQLTLSLNAGDLSDIKDARFHDTVEFADGLTSAQSDDMVYLATSGKLTLVPNGTAGKKSHLLTGRIDVSARNITVELNAIVIDASGDLTTQTSPDKTASPNGLFDASKPTRAKANSLHYEDTSTQAVYTGAARISQGAGKDETFIAGDKVTLDSTAGDLKAEGGVTAKFPLNTGDAAQKEAPSATATRFDYSGAKHRALYTGTEKERAQFNSADGIIRGVTIEMGLSDTGKELKSMVVDSPAGSKLVQARITADRTALGDRVVQDVNAGTYLLTGSPARLIQRSVDKGVESCTEVRGAKIALTKSNDPNEQGTFTADPGQAGTTSRNLANCADWIIK